MKVSEFNYPLPAARIAQAPLPEREASRMLALERASSRSEDRRFCELPELLAAGDLLVINDCKVIPARLRGTRPGGGRIELTLLQELSAAAHEWECLVKGRRPRPGLAADLGDSWRAEFLDERPLDCSENSETQGGLWRVRLSGEGPVPELLERQGRAPLPPYISRENGTDPALDRERYQTIFARRPGAAAAPTAGLHFGENTLKALEARGVRRAAITLWVGLGTFAPVRVAEVERHRMHPERYELPEATAQAIAETRSRGGRVVAVGTTVTRTLEHCARADGSVAAGAGWTDLFIYPGYRFRVVDGLLTNFHLPGSTLLMLVAALAGRERIQQAYAQAMAWGYRFLSYGDCMLIR